MNVINSIFAAIILLSATLFYETSAFAAEQRLKIGVSLPLTGALAEYGRAIRNGIELAREDFPQQLASVDFIFEDDQYLPKNTLTAINKFIAVDHAALAFVWGNEPALAAAPVAEGRKFPIVVVAHHPQAATAQSKYVLRFMSPAAKYSQVLSSHLRKQGLKRFLAISADISFNEILLNEFKNHLATGETLERIDPIPPTETDFRTLILKLKSRSDYDALGVYLLAPQLKQFFKQAAEVHFHPTVFGSTTFENKTVIAESLGLMEGAVFSHISPNAEFISRYQQKFGDDSQVSYAGNAYDFAYLIGQALGSAASVSPEQVLPKLKNIKEFRGVSGDIRLNSTPEMGEYFEFPVYVKQISNGQLVVKD